MTGLWTVPRLPAAMESQWTVSSLPPTAFPHPPWTSLRLAHSRLENCKAVYHTAHRPGDDEFSFSLFRKSKNTFTAALDPNSKSVAETAQEGGTKKPKMHLSSDPFCTPAQPSSLTLRLPQNTGSIWPHFGGSDRAPLDKTIKSGWDLNYKMRSTG